MDQPPPERKTFIIAFESTLSSEVLASEIAKCGQPLQLLPNVFAVQSRWTAMDIGLALRPFTKVKEALKDSRKFLFVIETPLVIWEPGLSLDIDTILHTMLRGLS
jgi:hypothetical protein